MAVQYREDDAAVDVTAAPSSLRVQPSAAQWAAILAGSALAFLVFTRMAFRRFL